MISPGLRRSYRGRGCCGSSAERRLRPRRSAPEAVVATNPVVADVRPSLVVLPVDSLSDDKEQAYLADGITEDFTTALARIPGLFVISRDSAFTYKDKTTQPAQVAKDLGVRYILEARSAAPEEAASAKAELQALGKAIGSELTGLRAMNELPFKQRDDMVRLWTGLSKAGVPEFPFGYNRRTGLPAKKSGRWFSVTNDTGEPYMRSTAPDGTAKMSLGSWSPSGVSQIEWDFLCTLWDTHLDTACVTIFRNPGGSHEKQNEYVVADGYQTRNEFSVVK